MIIINDGKTIPRVATKDPITPNCLNPIKVATLIANGPGVDSEIAKKLASSASLIHPLLITSLSIIGIMA